MHTCEPILGRLRKAVPRLLVVDAFDDKIVAALGTCVPRRDCGTSRQGPSTDARLMQNGKPSLLLPDRPLPGLAAGLVDVIFETIERIREQDDTVLLLEQHAVVAFEIADYLCVPEFGKLDMLGTQAARRVLRHRSQPGRPFW
jgi:ABC-type thiamine transport system ATPase subunit